MARKNTRPSFYENYVFSKDRLSVKITNCNITYIDKNRKPCLRHNQNVSGYINRNQLKNVKYEEILDFIMEGKIEVWGLNYATQLTNESKIVFIKENPYI